MPATIFRRSILLVFILLGLTAISATAQQADAENCNLCHGLALLGITTPAEGLRSFEVSSAGYKHSTHRNVICRDCHTDINVFPHPEDVAKVECYKACHITKPFALTGYSHVEQADAHAVSIHGFNPEYSDEKNAAKPDCKYCHSNSFRNVIKHEILEKNSQHCVRCHEGEGLAGVILHVNAHSGHRTAEASIDVVELCSSCHADQSHMQQFDVNLTQVAGYERQFHGKALKRGMDEVANCMDCHRNHLILPPNDPNSSINQNNIQQTCSSNGSCHSNASAQFTAAAIHSEPTTQNNPILFFVEWGFIILTAGTMALLFAHIFLDFSRWVGDIWMRRKEK